MKKKKNAFIRATACVRITRPVTCRGPCSCRTRRRPDRCRCRTGSGWGCAGSCRTRRRARRRPCRADRRSAPSGSCPSRSGSLRAETRCKKNENKNKARPLLSLSRSSSHASPRPSPSVSSWSKLGIVGQLSHASPFLSDPSVSESVWSGFDTSGQLSLHRNETRVKITFVKRGKTTISTSSHCGGACLFKRSISGSNFRP